MHRTLALRLLPAIACISAPFFFFETAAAQAPVRPRITGRVNENALRTIAGNTRPEATAQNDTGPVPDDFAMDHLLLQLKRSPEQEQAASDFIDRLHNPNSSDFHQWMTPAEFGQAFGAAPEDINTVKAWLESHGLTVNSVYPNGLTIDFSGTSGQLRSAFHAGIHYLSVNGARHVANMSDPQIPAALAPVVEGLASLHDFSPRPLAKPRASYTFSMNQFSYQALVPGDLAAIYNLNPLFAAGITGKGQTIALIEDTNLYTSADWTTFRSTFGLSKYSSGTLTTLHPSAAGGINCLSPGVNSDDIEAILDAEWASAAAPDAAIVMASCANTRGSWGGMIALQNLINGANPPTLISMSYGQCEAENGAALNALFNTAFQQAVAEGISVFVAAGDEGAASCDAGAVAATHGIGVSGFASSPNDVAVGGTDFGDVVSGAVGRYWNVANSTTYVSALSYIPELPWNDSCANSVLSSYLKFATPYGISGFCNSALARQYELQTVVAGSGGPSGCATGAPSSASVVGGTCKGFAKPSWQTGLAGIPQDGVRDMPDVSLFAGDGVWGHYYVMCFSDKTNGGAPCTGAPSNWAGGGGTSFASPIMAGIQALVNQKMKSTQGNPNYVYYKLAATAGAVCNSQSGDSATSTCIFHNVTKGDISVNCSGTDNCYGAAGQPVIIHNGRIIHPAANTNADDGALSTSSATFIPAYGTSAGWNFATGIGSVNAYNLVMNWP